MITRAALENYIKPAADLVNQALLDECLIHNSFLLHCQIIRDFLLFGRSDFVENLLDSTKKFFARRASTLCTSELVITLEQALIDTVGPSAFESSSFFYHLEPRLDPTTSFTPTSDPVGESSSLSLSLSILDQSVPSASASSSALSSPFCDAFYLSYSPPTLLRPLFDDNILSRYSAICRLLWQLSRVCYTVSQAWKRGHTVLQRKLSLDLFPVKNAAVDRLLQAYVKRVSVCLHRLSCGLSNLRSYFMNQVIHQIFARFEASLHRAKDLDDLIETHRYYVSSIFERCLLALSEKNIKLCLEDLFDIAHNVVSTADKLHQFIIDRVHRSFTRAALESSADSSQEQLGPAEIEQPTAQEQARIDEFTARIVSLEQQYDRTKLRFNALVHTTDLPTL